MSLGAERNRLEGHSEQVNAVAYSADGEWIASGSDDDTLKVWYANGELLQTVPVDGEIDGAGDAAVRSRVTSIAFHPEGETIATAHSNGQVSLWAIKPDTSSQVNSSPVSLQQNISQRVVPQQVISAHSDWVTSVAYAPDGERLATSSRDGRISIWTAEGTLLKTLMSGHQGWVNTVNWHPDGQQLASGGEDGKIKVWDTESGDLVWEAVAHQGKG